jgi:hypothetical protein
MVLKQQEEDLPIKDHWVHVGYITIRTNNLIKMFISKKFGTLIFKIARPWAMLLI